MANLVRREGTGDFLTLPDLVGRFFSMEPAFTRWATTFAPSVDIVEKDQEFRIVAEVPGLVKENINVTLEGTTLTISGEKTDQFEKETEKGAVYQSERRYGRFTRSFTLPSKVDSKKIAGSYKDGVLEIVIPKAQEAQPQKVQIAMK